MTRAFDFFFLFLWILRSPPHTRTLVYSLHTASTVRLPERHQAKKEGRYPFA